MASTRLKNQKGEYKKEMKEILNTNAYKLNNNKFNSNNPISDFGTVGNVMGAILFKYAFKQRMILKVNYLEFQAGFRKPTKKSNLP